MREDTAAQNTSVLGLPDALGWYEIPTTKLSSVCPNDDALHGNSGCQSVISAWNSGVADTNKNRLIFFGGGHTDYYGNEVYAIDINGHAIRRITEPSPVTNLADCPETYADGTPSARHTYNGLAFIPDMNSLYLVGGAKPPCGNMSNSTWLLNLDTLKWSSRDPVRGDVPAATPGIAANYDPLTKLVFLTDTQGFFSYDPRQNAYVKLRSFNGVDYHLNAVLDPDRREFFIIGADQFWMIDIGPKSKYELVDLARRQSGCQNLLHISYPGLAYDTKQKVVIGWPGGDNVYVLDTKTYACKELNYPGGPGIAQENGTNGHFRYFPDLGVFAVVNSWNQNAYTLRLSPKAD